MKKTYRFNPHANQTAVWLHYKTLLSAIASIKKGIAKELAMDTLSRFRKALRNYQDEKQQLEAMYPYLTKQEQPTE